MFHSFLIGFHWIGAPCIPPPDAATNAERMTAVNMAMLMMPWWSMPWWRDELMLIQNASNICTWSSHALMHSCSPALMLSCTHALMYSCTRSHALILTCTQDSNDHPMSFSSWPYGLPMAPPIFHMLYEYDTNMISNCSSWTLKPHEHQNQPITSDLKFWKKNYPPNDRFLIKIFIKINNFDSSWAHVPP